MAYTTYPGRLWLPSPPMMPGVPALYTNETNASLSGTSRIRTAWMFQVPKDGTLDKFELYCSFISAPSDVKFSFQDVDPTTGLPDGVVDQFRVLAAASVTATWLAPGLMTSDGTNGGVKRAVTALQWIAVVLEWDSTQSGQAWFSGVDTNSNTQMSIGQAYAAVHNGASWSKYTANQYPAITLKYDDGTYESPVGWTYPISATAVRSFASNSTPDERGVLFSLSQSVKVNGAWAWVDLNAAADIVIYNPDGSELVSAALDSDLQQSASPGTKFYNFAKVTLKKNTNYRMVLRPTTTTSISIYEYTANAAAILNGFAPGSAWQLTTRTDAGAWTETATQRPWMGLLISDVQSTGANGAGGGSTGGLGGGGAGVTLQFAGGASFLQLGNAGLHVGITR